MKFTDGMEINTEGDLRVIHKSDGYYVTGQGMLMAVDTPEEGRRFIRELMDDMKKGER